jgi:coproporphyrinogen III oxidase-like Fe-S oxidoreductase
LPAHYLARDGSAPARRKSIASAEIALEFMMNGLRLKQGVPTAYLSERTGLATSAVEAQIHNLQSKGLMESNSENYQTTALGYQFLNTVLQSFD